MAALEGPERKSQICWLSGGTVALAFLLLMYLLLSVKRNELKPLWFDELGTLNVATQPTLGQMFRVEPGDGSPPLQYFLVRASVHLLGTSELALRTPALLFEFVALVGAYVFVGRRYGAVAGLVASAMLAISRPGDYGVEARPYGILLGLTMLMLVLWQRAAERNSRRGALLTGLGLTVFAITITHALGLFWAAVPLLSAEAYRGWRTRRIDRAMLLAILLGLCGFAITSVSGRATHQVLVAAAGGQHPAVSVPTLHKLHEALREEGFFPALLLLVPVGCAAWWARSKEAKRGEYATRSEEPPLSPRLAPVGAGTRAPAEEWVAVGAMVFTMLLVYLFTLSVTHYFWPRYLMPGVLGSFLLLGMLCGSLGESRVTALVLVLALSLSVRERRQYVREQQAWPSGPPVPVLLSESDPAEPILIGSPVLFPQIWWYSPPALRGRVHYIADAQYATTNKDFIGDLTLLAMHDAGSPLFPPDKLDGFLAENPKFFFLKSPIDNGDWIEGVLRSRQYRFTPVAHSPYGETLFQVSGPAGASLTPETQALKPGDS